MRRLEADLLKSISRADVEDTCKTCKFWYLPPSKDDSGLPPKQLLSFGGLCLDATKYLTILITQPAYWCKEHKVA